MTVTKNSTKNYVGRFVKRRGAADGARNTRENIFVQNTLAICCCCGGGCCCCCCCCCGRLKDFFLKSGKPFILLLWRWRKRLHSNTLRLWRRCPPRGCRAFTCRARYVPGIFLKRSQSSQLIYLLATGILVPKEREHSVEKQKKVIVVGHFLLLHSVPLIYVHKSLYEASKPYILQ